MDLNQYNHIFQYLFTNQLPFDLTTPYQIKQFKNFCIPFLIKNNFLYKKDKRKQNNILRVIRLHEMKAVLYIMHNLPTAGHFATVIMFDKIRSQYFWPQMYKNI